MMAEKSIVIGCDDTDRLTLLLSAFKETCMFKFRITSVTRGVDLVKITKAVEPDIIVLSFWNNQLIIDTCFQVSANKTPVLCVTRGIEIERLCWSAQHIMFTYSIEHIKIKNHLCSCINSIFLLQHESPAAVPLAAVGMPGVDPAAVASLSRYIMELDQKSVLLTKVKNRIAGIHEKADNSLRGELSSIVNAIKIAQNDKHLWIDFKLHFEQANPNFFGFLAARYPYLTPIDLKYCCYLKMDMSYDDIRNLLGINQESVRTHTYRLKKKLSLTRSEDLRKFLRSAC
ncbi:hypothetical protein GWR56_13170 [Mucilaginibacter sp. 14171R-50]|uniref:helix-turn-helix transcriptional regulator n=1 Tax=Mucilaginibacter sp. 14171R-50 TaxID=2703789 RepID=UPI00138DCF94|nr:hypothetical protein [Mucilaginibacter sp. 14171R-50]QHS56441.1 hypothetical protein GWR56_13170 [Mucilaginibacter sp. 14171R-50]